MVRALNDRSNEILHDRQPLVLKWDDFKWPLMFLLSMAMMGLKFPLGYIFVPLILINRFRADRYDFLIMLTIFFGGFAFISENTLPVKPWDIGLIVAVAGAVFYRKDAVVRKTLFTIIVYGLCLILIATFSDESIMVQLRTIRNYLYFICFIIPLIVFAGRKFEIAEFFHHLFAYVAVICIFYVLDCFVVNGQIFVPCTHVWGGYEGVFYSPIIFSWGSFPRKYPPGLFIAVLAVYPFVRTYRFTGWQLLLVVLTFVATRTFTVITGFIFEYFCSLSKLTKLLKYLAVVLALGVVVYMVDAELPKDKENQESAMRIYSSVKQILDLREAVDDEDIAKLGSGRMGQAIPKVELVSEYGKEAVGLGFLHPELTTDPRYIIYNTYYIDSEKAEEVATGIEIEPAQVYVTCGYMGLILHILFFVLTYVYIRRYRYASYYLIVIATFFWFGLGGFAQLNAHDGLILASLAYGVVLLDVKNDDQEGAGEV